MKRTKGFRRTAVALAALAGAAAAAPDAALAWDCDAEYATCVIETPSTRCIHEYVDCVIRVMQAY